MAGGAVVGILVGIVLTIVGFVALMSMWSCLTRIANASEQLMYLKRSERGLDPITGQPAKK